MTMRELILKMSLSVDGFVAGPNGELEWIFETMDREVTEWIVDTLWQAGVHIMGAATYRDMANYWPNRGVQTAQTQPFAAPMNEIPKVVFSRR
jgi:dihydrofolate reductase